MAIGRAAPLARPLQPPPMSRQVGRGRGRGRAHLPPGPPGLAPIYCLPVAEVNPPPPPPKTSSLPGGFDSLQLPMRTSPLPAEAEGDRGRPIVVRYDFPQAEPNLPRFQLPARSEPRVPSPAASVVDDAELHVDPPASWVMEEPQPRITTRPTCEAGYARPGCWNCREFGHSRIDCTLPRQRMCYKCGVPSLTIATCPTCCQDWGERRRTEMQREPQ